MSYVRMFGCVSYMHIDSVDKRKLDVNSIKCTFIGYGGVNLGYRFGTDKTRRSFEVEM